MIIISELMQKLLKSNLNNSADRVDIDTKIQAILAQMRYVNEVYILCSDVSKIDWESMYKTGEDKTWAEVWFNDITMCHDELPLAQVSDFMTKFKLALEEKYTRKFCVIYGTHTECELGELKFHAVRNPLWFNLDIERYPNLENYENQAIMVVM